jgi:microcystin degradation protein MlrC
MPDTQPLRVAILALLHESNTFVDGVTGRSQFESDLLAYGGGVRVMLGAAEHEVGGFFEALAEEGIEAVPVFAARAYPFGVVAAETFEGWVEEMLDGLDAVGPVDGVLAAAHGALVAEDHPDGAGWWLSRVRAMIGPDKPLIATLDLHSNLSEAMVQATDALVAYRTNPHLDQRETGRRAARLMARTLRGEVTPTQAAVLPPFAINIQCQNTSEPRLKELYDWAAMLEADTTVLSQSILLGFPYSDVPMMGSSVVVVTDNSPALAERLARSLAEDLWGHREQFCPTFVATHDALNEVMQSQFRFLLLDMGDNVGAGSPGHGTLLLAELHGRAICPAFVCLHDPAAVRLADAAGAGAWITLDLGRVSDGLHGDPVCANCQVLSLNEGKFKEAAVCHGGFLDFDQGRTAVVETDRGVTVMLTTYRMPPFSLEQLYSCGLNPRDFRVLVAKGVIAPLAAYGPVVNRVIAVNTPGVTCADLTQLPFHHRRKPMFPFERDIRWDPAGVAGHTLGIPLRPAEGGDTGPLPSSHPPNLLCPAK